MGWGGCRDRGEAVACRFGRLHASCLIEVWLSGLGPTAEFLFVRDKKEPSRLRRSVRTATGSQLFNLRCERAKPGKIACMTQSKKNTDWSPTEIAAVVRSYLDMLALELAGQQYSKSAFRDRLIEQLQGTRSKGSIEFKHCNISAVMQQLGYPSIQGYKRRDNFQKSLVQEIERQLTLHPSLAHVAQSAVNQPAQVPQFVQLDQVWQEPPPRKQQVQESLPDYLRHSPARRDYLAQEARNQSLGLAGEQFVLSYERWKLQHHGLPDLAQRVEHVSVTLGDGLGFDIRSFDLEGNEQWIEVKTTSFAKDTPFFVTRNELRTSQAHADRYHL